MIHNQSSLLIFFSVKVFKSKMSLYNFLVGVYLPKLQDNNYKHNEYQSSNFNLWYHIIERIS
jgi:hypothetical protein